MACIANSYKYVNFNATYLFVVKQICLRVIVLPYKNILASPDNKKWIATSHLQGITPYAVPVARQNKTLKS